MFKIIIRNIAPLTLLLTSIIYAQASHALHQYTVTVTPGANGLISPNTTQSVDPGNSIKFTATPLANYMVNVWKVDGQVAQTGGTEFNLKNIGANHNVAISFLPRNLLYVGAANSYLYYSMDNGMSWHTTPNRPNINNAIAQVVASDSTVYVVNTGKYVYYSADNGTTWTTTKYSPDYGRLLSIFVTPCNKIYIGSKKGNIFVSENNGVSWTKFSQLPGVENAVTSLYVTLNAIYAGASDGKVYYSTDGTSWIAINGSPDGSPIRGVYVTNHLLYVNTANEYLYNSPNLTGGGTWTPFAQSVYSVFVNGDGSVINTGTQDGFVYSLSTSDELGLVSYTRINSLYFLG